MTEPLTPEGVRALIAEAEEFAALPVETERRRHLVRRLAAALSASLPREDADLDALLAPLPEDARMQAYYYGFEPTGVGPVDAILSAVAVAGKGLHSTEDWGDDQQGTAHWLMKRPGITPGESAEEMIQNTAKTSAETIEALAVVVRERDKMLSKISAAVAAGSYSNRELREAIQYIANVLDGADQREPRATCFCGGEHITGTCLAGAEEAGS